MAEWGVLRMAVFAAAAIALLYVLLLFVNLPQKNPIEILEGQIQVAQTSVGKLNTIKELQFKQNESIGAETFDSEARSVSFNCNNIERCCEIGTKCQKIEWDERKISAKDSKPIISSARCDYQYGIFPCKIYFGTIPAQIEISKIGFEKLVDLKNGKTEPINIELKNSGEMPTYIGKINAKLFIIKKVKNATTKELIEEKNLDINEMQPGKTINEKTAFELPIDGNYFAEITASGEDAGFDKNTIYFNAIDSRESLCHATEEDDTISWDSITQNCKQKFYCEKCTYAFECKELWEKQINVKLKESDYTNAYFETPCKPPETQLLDPTTIGIQAGTGSAAQNIAGRKTIVLDPGHGPVSAAKAKGCSTYNPPIQGITEDTIAFDITQRVQMLLQNAKANVLLTRTSQTDPDCKERADVANNNKADLFVSIHINAGGGSGSETFFKQNGKFSKESTRLAQIMEQELQKATGLKSRGAKPDTQTAVGSLGVFNNNYSTPAVLTEPLFIDNPSENAKLKDPVFRQKIAQGIFNAIISYYGGNFSTGSGNGNEGNNGNNGTVPNFSGKLSWPLPNHYWISSCYGKRRIGDGFHDGIDIPAPKGTPVIAGGSGTVYSTCTGRCHGYGNHVVVKHSSNLFSQYNHLEKFIVKKGDSIQQGQTVGYVDSTGFSTGNHLDFKVYTEESQIGGKNTSKNPICFLTPEAKAKIDYGNTYNCINTSYNPYAKKC